MGATREQVTVGVDIGTTSVKAVAADEHGTVLARARVPHDLVVPSADRLEHRPDQAWRAGVLEALGSVARDLDVAGVVVSAMVPSACAVDADGAALTPGLLYGDERGGDAGADPSASGEFVGFASWCAGEASGAAGIWPAQAMANHALSGEAVLDTTTAMTTVPLFDYTGWDPDVCERIGARPEQFPRVVPSNEPAGTLLDDRPAAGAVLGAGTVDALGEQLVAGAERDGDVLVILGATLISWAVIPEWRDVDGLWTLPHSAPGKSLIGGPSNAGGLFLDWARRIVGDPSPTVGDDSSTNRRLLPDPASVPVWTPYPRGERVPLHDPSRRAGLHGLDLTHGPAGMVRAAHEAGGFVIRHQLDLAGLSPERIVATGGGTRSAGWVQAIADATGLPVDVVVVPEGAALGAAFQARVVAGLESDANDARGWARTDRTVEPDPAWLGPVAERYERFRHHTANP